MLISAAALSVILGSACVAMCGQTPSPPKFYALCVDLPAVPNPAKNLRRDDQRVQTDCQAWTNGLIQPLDRGDFDKTGPCSPRSAKAATRAPSA